MGLTPRALCKGIDIGGCEHEPSTGIGIAGSQHAHPLLALPLRTRPDDALDGYVPDCRPQMNMLNDWFARLVTLAGWLGSRRTPPDTRPSTNPLLAVAGVSRWTILPDLTHVSDLGVAQYVTGGVIGLGKRRSNSLIWVM